LRNPAKAGIADRMFSLRTIRTQLIHLLHLKDSPHRTALAFALGVFIAFAPHYGFHTVSVVFCAWALRLNYLAVFLGSLLNNPWTLVPILFATLYTGCAILGIPHLSPFGFEDFQLENLYDIISQYFLPFVVGGCALGLLGSLVAYPFMLIIIKQYRPIKSPSPENPDKV
jgi:hypothetical protein